MKERENKRKNLLLVNRSFHLRWMIIRLFFPLRCGGGGLREYLPSIDGWMMTVTVTIYKAEAEATESKKNRRDASRRQAFPVCFRAGQFGAHVKGHAPGKRMGKDGMDDYTTRRIRLALLLVLCHCILSGPIIIIIIIIVIVIASQLGITYCYLLQT